MSKDEKFIKINISYVFFFLITLRFQVYKGNEDKLLINPHYDAVYYYINLFLSKIFRHLFYGFSIPNTLE